MEEFILYAATVFMGFFAISNPIANAPAFISLTKGKTARTIKRVARRALFIAFLIVALFSMAGKIIFDMFGITLDAFRITGGLLVLFIGFEMLKGKGSDVEQPQSDNPEECKKAVLSFAVTPLAMPLIAGPGTIATAMNFSSGKGFQETIVTIAAFATLCLVTYIVFTNGSKIVAYLGSEALSVLTKLMGLLIAVIGTQMMIQGILGAFFFGHSG